MIKNVQHIKTIFPIGRNDESNVCTTNLSPGALLITRNGLNDLNKRNTYRNKKNKLIITIDIH